MNKELIKDYSKILKITDKHKDTIDGMYTIKRICIMEIMAYKGE